MSNAPKIYPIIPARGGSKGIPKKNIQPLAGKPLIAYTIEAALESEYLEDVFVSTDDEEIAKASENHGASIIERPSELATDTASSESALQHAVEEIESERNEEVDIITFLQCTSPLRGSEVIDEALEKMFETEADSVLSAYKDYRYLGKLSDGEYVPFREERKRRQDMEPYYCDNGALYVMKRHILMEQGSRYGGTVKIVEMSEEDSHEIDTEQDFWLAEQLFKKKNS